MGWQEHNTINRRETVVERFNSFIPAIKKHFTAVISSTSLLATYPISTAANNYSLPAACSQTAVKMSLATAAPPANLGLAQALAPIIALLQELALPVGIGMSIWGLIEIMIGNAGGKDKIKLAILGYIGVFIIPFFFYKIEAAFQSIPLG